jgi:hypothetical protein
MTFGAEILDRGLSQKDCRPAGLLNTLPRQSIRGFCINIGPSGVPERPRVDASETIVATSDDRTLWAFIEPSSTGTREAAVSRTREHNYVIGDEQDADPNGDEFLGHGALLHINASSGRVHLRTSITGFPPVFVYKDSERTVVASSVDRIAAVPDVHLAFDPQGLVDFAVIGQPIKHRTLFCNVSIVPAGVGLMLDLAGGIRTVEHWRPSRELPFVDWQEYVAMQEDAMTAALRRMDLSRSFLSLTAGLDTRVILALLCRNGPTLNAFTKSGEFLSLDARRAKELCSAYGMMHTVISLTGDFISQFPECANEASRRSGGLRSFSEASEVFFYRALRGAYDARLCGNFGNQVGRSGTEGAGMRSVPINLLASDLIRTVERVPNRHWFEEIADSDGGLGPLQLIQQESLFASIGNFGIGSSYATQKTPYADRTMILQKLREPALRDCSTTAIAVRLRDLKHRFLGDPMRTSFQRQIVAHAGGVVARSPINWGWRASGGVSVAGLTLGILALLDLVASTRLPRDCLALRTMAQMEISGLSGFQSMDLLEKRPVAEFVYDVLGSNAAQCSSVLNQAVFRRALAKGFGDRSARPALLFALDVVLAQRNFGVVP